MRIAYYGRDWDGSIVLRATAYRRGIREARAEASTLARIMRAVNTARRKHGWEW